MGMFLNSTVIYEKRAPPSRGVPLTPTDVSCYKGLTLNFTSRTPICQNAIAAQA